MAKLDVAPGEHLYYEYDEAGATGKTFVFVNALTGDTSMWQSQIAPALRSAGYGTLCFNFRGQAKSECHEDTRLTPDLIVDDLVHIIDRLAPKNPVLVGLSIGGLFAAQAHLAGARSIGLVLINTLRKRSKRLEWINRAMVELAHRGGTRLRLTANAPMLVNPEFLAGLWESTFSDEPFVPMAPNDGLFRLMQESLNADWDLPYERLDVPVLLMTGRHDRVFRIDADVAELSARIQDAREIVYPDAGHLIPVERPAQFEQDLAAFAEQL